MDKSQTNKQEPFFWIKGGQTPQKPQPITPSIEKPIEPAAAMPRMLAPTPKNNGQAARAGLQPGWIRATFILKEDNLRKLKAVAHWERTGIKDILNEALTAYLAGKKIGSPNT